VGTVAHGVRARATPLLARFLMHRATEDRSMARPIWTGAISFGLVNVPVKLISAVHQREVHFHMLHDADGGRIEFKRVCKKDGAEVPYEHIVKGYEVSKGKSVVLTKKELAALDAEATRAIDIEDFVAQEEIDPIHYDATYYLVPDRGAQKPYVLLLEAMRKTDRVAVGRMVMRTKQYLVTLRPMGKALALSTMQYADEIVPISDLEGLPAASAKPTGRELELAEKLIDSLSSPFQAKKYKDDHRERVLELIERKAAGEEIVVDAPKEKPAKTVDLFEALKASLGAPRKKAPSVAAATPRRPTRRAAAARPRPRTAPSRPRPKAARRGARSAASR
jgi:DNA end-binding protein Ku